ncbi:MULTISPECIES: phosphate ABC transporter substrate-binding protein PstS [unclassified Modestobacter]|uniref:phosphate ABC transporter substrate-binding protein PstS n=1 Tax=unclassified Modestobacter TaxID=2643866 RepID=UPI0022AA83F0|nr:MULTISPECIES: phosphate ABC transporter substrate-binding protein PstS [unclassified Modestobacter]MCZ2811420.1 phosphate ABC transporter substrate-binding protein PstS [Modestobacter sp. VKM Ac-2979]MCZ2840933.1 phosphate ABC transporter substrate-binding protein PstS [Modestobacter sp. VKM Ac-2980]MCZ2848218.1 phosphate ABC transporter substrate-binding protein PstS [Modestobacter sp. VKM Ac-2978]
MKLSTTTRTAAVSAALAATLALAACGASNEESGTGTSGGDSGGELSGTLVGAGASSQQAAMQGWTAGYSSVQPDVTVNYDPIGSGGGREQFLAGGTDFAGSDAALDEEELAQAEERCGESGIFELANYIAPIAVVYNVEGVDELNLSPEVLAGIFNQQITNWNDPAIAADNPDATLPDLPITPVNRSDESGTTENFTEYLVAAAGDAWPHEASGDWPVSGGEAAQGTSGVVSAVGAGNGSIGYADLSQAGDLGVANIGVGEEFVEPTAEAAAAVVENSETLEGRGEYDFAIELARDTTESGNYPIVLISYHVGCVEYEDQETADLVADFMSYVVSEEGQQAAAEAAGSAPISDNLREQAQGAIDAITAAG